MVDEIKRMEVYQQIGSAEKLNRFGTGPYNSDPGIPGVYQFQKENSTYGLFGIGDVKWFTSALYNHTRYLENSNSIYLSGSDNHTVVNLTSGEIIDLQDISQTEGFTSDGIIYKTKANKYRALALDGKLLFESDYEEVGLLSDGLCRAKHNGKYGYINYRGEIVIDFQYDKAYSFSNGYAEVYLGDRKVKENDIYVSYDAGWGVIDKTGKMIIDPQWENVDTDSRYVLNGLVKVQKDEHFGLYSLDGKEILSPVYNDIGMPGEGLIYIQKLAEKEENYPSVKAGWVDYSGNMVLDLIALGIDGPREVSEDESHIEGRFINGVAVISHWLKKPNSSLRDIVDLIISKDGTILRYGSAGDDTHVYLNPEGFIRMWKIPSGAMNIINTGYYKADAGTLIELSESEYEYYTSGKGTDNSENPRLYVDMSTAFYKQWAKVYNFSSEGIAKVALNSHEGKYGEIIDPPYGFVKDDGTILVDPVFQNASDFENGYAIVQSDNQLWGIIDTSGNYAIQPKYDEIPYSVTKDHTLIVGTSLNGSMDYKIITVEDIALIENITDFGSATNNEFFVVKVRQSGTGKAEQWQIYDTAGKRLF